jgi:hypothetical protein
LVLRPPICDSPCLMRSDLQAIDRIHQSHGLDHHDIEVRS